ncbi:ATP-dependent DNA helicase RecG [Spirochaetia bacterium]|nr:ATP-dependent DNA helicase RecG [Spirochaetia bacterium]
MTTEQIKQLIADGEGLTVEFKKCTNALNNSVFETVCSFSNRYGGYILLGVDDDGTLIGVNRSAVTAIKNNFANMLNNPQRLAPTLYLNLQEITVKGKIILCAYIPVSSQIQSFGGRIYDRNEDGDFDISGSTELIAHLARRKSTQFTEREIFPYAKKTDFRFDLMPQIKQRAINTRSDHPWANMSDMEIMKSSGLYEEDRITGKVGFNRAAILLFGRDEIIQQAVPGYVTDCLFRVDNVDRYDDRERIETNLIESFGKIMAFIEKHTLDRFFLIDNVSVSVRSHIARELVSNILMHREYSGTFPARIIIEKERIITENWNRSLHPGRITLENLNPYPKNPILARFFVNIGYADTLGSGVRNLYRYTKIYSGGTPELLEGDIFKTIVPLLREGSISDNVPVNVPVNVPENVPVNVPVKNTTDKILAIITNDSNTTYDEIADKLSLTRKTVQRHIQDLKNSGVIKRIGSDKKGHWQIIEKHSEENP